MEERPVVEIFKTKLSWDVDAYHAPRETKSSYAVKSLNDDHFLATEDFSTIPEFLMSFYKPGTEIKLLGSKEHKIVSRPFNTRLEIVNEPLDNVEISDLLTAFANETYRYPYQRSNSRIDEMFVFKAQANYTLSWDKHKLSNCCFVVIDPKQDSYLCIYDDIWKMPRSLLSNFMPGSRIIVPDQFVFQCFNYSLNEWTINKNNRASISHLSLTLEEKSRLLDGFAYDLHYIKGEYEKNREFGPPPAIYF